MKLGLGRALRQAREAEARGEVGAAYALLAAALPQHPTHPRLAGELLRLAAARGRSSDAMGPVLGAIRALTARGAIAKAADLWIRLEDLLPEGSEGAPTGSRIDAGTLLRLVPALRERDPDRARRALRRAVDPRTPGMTPGLAVRLAELARAFDASTAQRAAEIALRAPDLHEKRRAKLHRVVMELAREQLTEEAARASAPPAISPDDVIGGLAPLSLRPPDLRPRGRPPAPKHTGGRYEDFSGWLDDEGS